MRISPAALPVFEIRPNSSLPSTPQQHRKRRSSKWDLSSARHPNRGPVSENSPYSALGVVSNATKDFRDIPFRYFALLRTASWPVLRWPVSPTLSGFRRRQSRRWFRSPFSSSSTCSRGASLAQNIRTRRSSGRALRQKFVCRFRRSNPERKPVRLFIVRLVYQINLLSVFFRTYLHKTIKTM